MLHPPMTIRPDEITRSGIIQPFGVRHTDPVAFARHEIDPFINAVRASGSNIVATIDGPGLGLVSPVAVRSLGQDEGNGNGNGNGKNDKWYYMAGGVVLGALAGWAFTKVL
jgi:hypothetical protein